MCRHLLQFIQSKEIGCANVCAFKQEVFLCANQAFLMWFELIHFYKTGEKLTFVSMYCTIKNNLMCNLVYHLLAKSFCRLTYLHFKKKKSINK